MRPQVGQVINNKYRLLRLIGDGGMGSVYEARHEVLGMSVALKFLHPELSRRQGLVQRFLQEAKVSAQIHSPHVVRVTDVDQNATGQAFIVLEYLEGKTLQTLYEDLYREGRRLSYADALEYAMQMLEGVEAAHRTGVVHRDIKPDNVMITRGPKGAPLLKLLDFGIAKLKVTGELERGLTRAGVIMGTPEYMAPEQAYSADTVDARADIFSLGVMIFEMLAGRRPVGGDDPQQIASAYLAGQVSKLSELMPHLDPALASAVQKAMAAMPKDRFDSVAEFRDALEPFAQAVRPQLGHPSHPSHPGLGATPLPGAVTPNTPAGPSPAAAAPATNLPADLSRVVPKTLPPEAEGGAAPDGRIPATPLGGFVIPGKQSWAGEGAQAAAAALAPTESAPPYQPSGGATSFASPLDLSPRPSGTAIGGPGFNGSGMGPGGPPYGGYGGAGTAPMSHPYAAVAPTAPAPSLEPRRKSRKGPPLLLILLLAGGIAGAVVGGLYAANHYAKVEDHKIEPITVAPTTTVASDPPPANRPATNIPTTPAKPPPVANVPQKPPPSKPNTPPGPGTAPSSQPPGTPPVIILNPTGFPPIEFPPIFGPVSPPNQPPPQQPQGGNTPPPQGGNTQPPAGNPPAGGDTPAPTSTGGRRPGGVILIPRH